MAGEATVAPGAATDATAPKVEAPGVLRQVWAILSPEERRRFVLLQPLVIFTAVLETAGLASIVPFLALLSDPQAIERHRALSVAYETLGFTSTTSFFFAVGVGVLLLVTLGNGANALTTWALLRFSWDTNHTLSIRLLESYLERPYAFFLEHNTSELAKNLLAEVSAVVGGVLIVLTQMLSRAVVLVGILATLLLIDPLMALGTGGIFGGLYGLMFAGVRNQLRRDGVARNDANAARHKVVGEALGGVKELKLYGLEAAAVAAYGVPSRAFGETQSRAAVIGQMPRYGLETIAFGGVLVIVLSLLWRGQRLNEVLPVLGLYAFAAYRMLPGLQAMFTGMTSLRFSQVALDTLHRDLYARRPAPPPPVVPVAFNHEVRLRDIRYSYPNAQRMALNGVNLTVRRGEWVALVGPTGGGKSTIVDMLLGILNPDNGWVEIDGVKLDAASALGWQRLVAYVPQQIFLVDDSVANNICFGEDVDVERMKEAARIAQIHEFIESDLPDGYETKIGERGIRLSGGQRQRIGIARALYRRPMLLVLDEATSALDDTTEAAFFNGLRGSSSFLSVVSVAHRLSTTRAFDVVSVIEKGRLVDSGTYVELASRSPHFMVNVQAGGGER